MANEITRWNPFREMANMQSTFDRFFDDWRPFSLDWRPFFADVSQQGNWMALDVHEDDHQYVLTTDLPGVKSENINVRQDGDYLLIEANIPDETTEKKDGERWLIKERRSGQYSRRVRLPQNINLDKAEATYHDGTLTLTLPKAENAQPRQIPVKAGDSKQ